MGEREELEALPVWVPRYLDCWGSKKPGGGRMTVTFAADFAGTTPEAVRQLRRRSPQFERMEWLARQGANEFAQSYAESGLRNRLPALMAALDRLLEASHPGTVLKLLEWILERKHTVKLEGDVGVRGAFGLGELGDDELDRLIRNLEVAAGSDKGHMGKGEGGEA